MIETHLPEMWETLAGDIGKNMWLVFKKKTVAERGNVRVAPLGAVVTSKMWIINDLSLDLTTVGGTKGGLNLDTVTQDLPRCLLCGEALPKLLAKNIKIRIKYPLKRILVSKADVSDAFRNVRISQSMQTRSAMFGKI